MTTATLKTISSTISKGRQSMHLDEVLSVGKAKIRVSIESDSYDFQCHAHVDLWNGTEWKRVHTIHHGAMKTESGLAYLPRAVTNADFAADREELLRVARAVI